MSIRRQSIISSFLVYIGFALGLLNTYLYAKGFAESQYGLINTFQAFATIMFSFSNVGITYYVTKFFPYYNDNLPPQKNDMIALALVTSITAFAFVVISGIVFKEYVIYLYAENSPAVVTYYYWLFPFGFGLSIYSILEAFAWQLRKSVLTNFLKEILFRLFATILIVLTFLRVINNFDVFIKIYAFTYIGIAGVLLVYLIATRRLHLTFKKSRVTKKFYKKIVKVGIFIWSGSLVYNIAQVFDTLVIGSAVGMAYVGIYSLAQNMSSLIAAPQRALSSAAIGPLAQAWKDKDMGRIDRIYHQSSINQLLFAIGMFSLVWLNFTDGVLTFHLKPGYLDARIIFLYIGFTKLIDMGTGVNSQIIGSSTFWKVEFVSGIILLLLTLPLNYLLTLQLKAVGPAIANLFAITVYNAIRYAFLWKKFKIQPFTGKTVYSLLLGAVCYISCYFLFDRFQGIGWIFLRSITFISLYAAGVLYFDLSPDVLPVWQTIRKRLRFVRSKK